MTRRKPWLAALLAMFSPGLGHLYVGKPGPALVLMFGLQVLSPLVMCLGLLDLELLCAAIWLRQGLSVALWSSQAFWALLLARVADDPYRPTASNHVAGYVAFAAVGAILGGVTNFTVRAVALEPFDVSSPSMAPALLQGDVLMVTKVGPASRIAHGDIVAHRVRETSGNTNVWVGRVVAMASDSIDGDGATVRVNDIELQRMPCTPPVFRFRAHDTMAMTCALERALNGKTYAVIWQPGDPFPQREIPATSLGPNERYVLKDDRGSYDSREHGPIRDADLVGRGAVIWFSYSAEDGIRWSRIGTRL